MMFRFEPAAPSDIDRLVALRLAVMRESLTQARGAFNAEKAEAWFRASYRPDHTRLIVLDPDVFAGCVALRPVDGLEATHLWLEHFYIATAQQGRGLGQDVLAAILAETDADNRVVCLSTVVGSRSMRLYRRFGFVETGVDGIDIFHERLPRQRNPPTPA